MNCKMMTSWGYHCEFETINGSQYCQHHNNTKCDCGKQATHLVRDTSRLFHFKPLCDKCYEIEIEDIKLTA